MPIDCSLPTDHYAGLVFLRLVELWGLSCDEGLDIQPSVYAHALLMALSERGPGDTLTICATPEQTLILRWANTLSEKSRWKEVRK